MDYGNPTREVTMIGRMWEGQVGMTVIPHSWYKHLKYGNGLPHLAAITILADIVYWYRPTEIRDEETGVATVTKKFKGKLLQRSRRSYQDQFGLSNQQVKDAFDFLESKGLIQVVVEPVVALSNGVKLSNVSYIRIFPTEVASITVGSVDPTMPVDPTPMGSIDPTYTEITSVTEITSSPPTSSSERRGEHQQKKIDKAWLNALYKAGLYNGKREAVARTAMQEGLGLEETLKIVAEVFALKEMYPPPTLSDPRAAAASALAEAPSLKGLVELERKAAKRRKQQQAPRVQTNEERYGKDRIFV